ncbi:MAG: hypothetical protein DRI44_06935 [Chlamydiae bacterium]|nr:MAG: hypothetical protein DRI44_06935 [Chlamydiota bacterium]
MLVTRKKLFYLKITALFFIFVMAVIFLLPNISSAQVDTGLSYMEDSGLATTDVRVVIARIIKIALGLLGTVAVVIILYGGFVWMTAGGNEDKVAQAKKVLLNGAIGLAIIIFAFSIASFVLNALTGATSVHIGEGGTTVPSESLSTGGLGRIIQSHYPGRDARDVARNTKIVVTFKEPIDASTIIKDGDDEGEEIGDSPSDRILTESVRIVKKGDSLEAGPFVEASAMVMEDQKTFRFKPIKWLGNASQDTEYIIYLSNDILKANGDKAFSQADKCEGMSGAYCWEFTVSTFADTTPPKVTSVFPLADTTVARNAIVQVNFSEAVDPISIKNINIIDIDIAGQDENILKGFHSISNEYKTVEFITNDLCGINSCGQDVFCLPKDINWLATVKSIDPDHVDFPYSGIVDMADNPLDGNGNGVVDYTAKTENTPAETDDYVWEFSTNDTIDLTPPKIEKLIHHNKDESLSDIVSPPLVGEVDVIDNVHLKEPIEIYFSKVMMSSTINNSNIFIGDPRPEIIFEGATEGVPWYGWFYPSSSNISEEIDGQNVSKTCVYFKHAIFYENSGYYPSISSRLKDIYQNCFWQPCKKEAGENPGVNCDIVPGPEVLIPNL